jgi:hypothetical protein
VARTKGSGGVQRGRRETVFRVIRTTFQNTDHGNRDLMCARCATPMMLAIEVSEGYATSIEAPYPGARDAVAARP